MSDTPWTRLQAPFPQDAVTFDPVELSDSLEEALMAPRLRRAAVAGRLDEVLGRSGWSVTFAPTEGAICCTLRVGDVVKGAVVDVGTIAPSAERAADAALARAAEGLGMRPPQVEGRWAPFDADEGTVLLEDDAADGVGDREAPPEPVPGSGAQEAADAASDIPGRSEVPDVLQAAAEARGLTAEGQRMIDRLVERLKDEGQGLAAARLLVRHGGYGADPAAARALYAELRELLLRAGEPVEGS